MARSVKSQMGFKLNPVTKLVPTVQTISIVLLVPTWHFFQGEAQFCSQLLGSDPIGMRLEVHQLWTEAE